MTQASGALLDVHAIDLWRGDRHLLRGLSFAVRPAELLRIQGPNGAGKTSLLRVICGLLPPESGEVLWRGAPAHSRSHRERFHAELAYLAHANAIKGDLTGNENLQFAVELRRHLEEDAYAQTLAALGIADCAVLPGRAFSAGQRRRLALARVLLSSATLWVLDEPTTNLDAAGVAAVEAAVTVHLDAGGCVLAAAHHALLADDARSTVLELN